MQSSTALVRGIPFPVHAINTLVIGSGAAALKAALSLVDRGQPDLAVVTEKWGGGTSNNSGSDKQTYYKLSLSGAIPDSPLQMAEDLYQGGCMHGDIALCEAQHSAQAFYELVQLGVPFPHDRYGGYTGYRTDHDQRGRATSAGPLTSHYMFEALAKRIIEKKVPVCDHHRVIALLTSESDGLKKVIGAVAFNLDELAGENYGLVLFNAVNVIFATGGPGGLYEMSVYPEDQAGSIGVALQIGAAAHNLTESQFGLASLKHRWNVSGSYQQVIPRYLSAAADGSGERDFLNEYFPDMPAMAGAIFRKGYQWPFDPRKIAGCGSSLIDLAVYQETVQRGRRVFLDFTRNPVCGGPCAEFDLTAIPAEAREYLEKSNALQQTPFERLTHLNPKAIELYRDHGINLAREYLEIAGCAQHNNGGLRANHWWESNIRHLFPVGEVNGTHGVYRPGGAALNAGQVGALRASMYIAAKYRSAPLALPEFIAGSQTQVEIILDRMAAWLADSGHQDVSTIARCEKALKVRMTSYGAQVRKPAEIEAAIAEAWGTVHEIASFRQTAHRTDLPRYCKALELALTHAVYLEAIGEYIQRGGASRGSYLIVDPKGEQSCGRMPDSWRFSLCANDSFVAQHILEISLDRECRVDKRWVPVRPIPEVDAWFENIWKDYLNGNLFDWPKNNMQSSIG